MNTKSILHSSHTKSAVEKIMHQIFLICGLISVSAVIGITLYMVTSGAPAIAKIGILDFLAGKVWNPSSEQFGILSLIVASLSATALSILLAVPIGLSTAIFLTHIAGKRLAGALLFLIELLASIPSVVYGLLGAILIAPMIFRWQEMAHLPAGGSLLAASIVLVIMILPTIISVSSSAIVAVPHSYYDASLALGSSKMQAILRTVLPAAKSGISAGIVLGVGRAIGETMAVLMVAGNAAVMPEFLGLARLLTVGISLEWAYSSGLHREALCGIGLVLFVFIMIINIVLSTILKKGGKSS